LFSDLGQVFVPTFLRWKKAAILAFVAGVAAVPGPPPVAGFAAGGVQVAELSIQDPQPLLKAEPVSGKGVWVDPALLTALKSTSKGTPVVVWFDRQLLGSGDSYARRKEEFRGWTRSRLRDAALRTLKKLSAESWQQALPKLGKMEKSGVLHELSPMWIVNGFSARLDAKGLRQLKKVPGVKKIFLGRGNRQSDSSGRPGYPNEIPPPPVIRSIEDYQHPWYAYQLLAVRAWKEFGFQGQGVVNVVHDFNFQYTPAVAANLFSNPGEIPGNGIDDDENGLVDDVHGYDFVGDSDRIFFGEGMHGFFCVNVLCGKPLEGPPMGFGLAPQSKWAGVIGPIERTVQWAVEQKVDTYSMSFSMPGLGEGRSHWRKVLEHGSLCGVYFASGAGNFGRKGGRGFAPVPIQMRTPEDIPEVVFASTGVHRDLSKTDFASKGPVLWELEHYQDGLVQKPEVCAFNHQIPGPSLDGNHQVGKFVNGNSLAGPMLCGTLAILLSADPEILPWDLMEVLKPTATDIAEPGVDFETGHGLINVYRAVKEVLRRKALREGKDPSPYTGRVDDDYFDATVYKQWGDAKAKQLFW
jgi:subtilase family protein